MVIANIGRVGRLGLTRGTGVGTTYAFTFGGLAFTFANVNFEWRP